MTMFRVLLVKDLRRAWRNPTPWIVFLLVPFGISALLGFAFGGRGESDTLGRIRFAVVDEDRSPLLDFLRGTLNQGEAGKHLEPVFLGREDALHQVQENQISAVLIIPQGFSSDYLNGRGPVRLELIKNPAQAWHPAVLEELLGAVVTGLNTLRQTLGPELQSWQEVFEGRGDYQRVAELIVRAGDRLKSVKRFIDPPLIGPADGAAPDAAATAKAGGAGNVFGFVLVGMTAMFLLFIAGNAMNDLPRELAQGTLARYHSLHHSLAAFIAGKVAVSWTILLLGSAILLGGGGLVFRLVWRHPGAVAALCAAYALFASGLLGLLMALAPGSRRAETVTNIAAMAIGLVGGCAFPPEQLPTFVRVHITPLVPTFWFTDTVRSLQFGNAATPWIGSCLAMTAIGAVCLTATALLFRRRIEKGLRP